MRKINVVGKRVGRLVGQYENGKYVGCLCDCGNTKEILRVNFLAAYTQSCGCYRNERVVEVCGKHGQKTATETTKTYQTWQAMKRRCDNPNQENYKYYGGRGITYCEAWKEFINFFADMGARPDGMELDRIDNNGNYCPENCRWISHGDNVRNRGY